VSRTIRLTVHFADGKPFTVETEADDARITPAPTATIKHVVRDVRRIG
jgi:hypothetical protein